MRPAQRVVTAAAALAIATVVGSVVAVAALSLSPATSVSGSLRRITVQTGDFSIPTCTGATPTAEITHLQVSVPQDTKAVLLAHISGDSVIWGVSNVFIWVKVDGAVLGQPGPFDINVTGDRHAGQVGMDFASGVLTAGTHSVQVLGGCSVPDAANPPRFDLFGWTFTLERIKV